VQENAETLLPAERLRHRQTPFPARTLAQAQLLEQKCQRLSSRAAHLTLSSYRRLSGFKSQKLNFNVGPGGRRFSGNSDAPSSSE
jgi:hypothetical protein